MALLLCVMLDKPLTMNAANVMLVIILYLMGTREWGVLTLFIVQILSTVCLFCKAKSLETFVLTGNDISCQQSNYQRHMRLGHRVRNQYRGSYGRWRAPSAHGRLLQHGEFQLWYSRQ